MTTEEIISRDVARELYVARIERQCHKLDDDPSRELTGVAWPTRSATDYIAKPEIRREW